MLKCSDGYSKSNLFAQTPHACSVKRLPNCLLWFTYGLLMVYWFVLVLLIFFVCSAKMRKRNENKWKTNQRATNCDNKRLKWISASAVQTFSIFGIFSKHISFEDSLAFKNADKIPIKCKLLYNLIRDDIKIFYFLLVYVLIFVSCLFGRFFVLVKSCSYKHFRKEKPLKG